ncbi:methyl-accepting chemotaxis protein [Pseudoalteromonas sp. G4]|uniref:methyl-accepting chemotaxis protein n=1 Tax=Pseudoalteromonas sp. G4 TaxID=2992761 RepID=UPI00237E8B4E|nr:HAMP domain-containing methyl-accepting chemotaxis protein [Pseudoalteromonas sp. G4]MDE3272811.1 methyl-accepting chemotaxis protein [Pseudoalteromonas sp. G4]
MMLSSFFSIYKLEVLLSDYDGLINNEVSQAHNITRVQLLFKDQVQAWKNTLIRNAEREKYWAQFSSLQNEIQTQLSISSKYQALQSQHQKLYERYNEAKNQLSSGITMQDVDLKIRGIDKQFSQQLTSTVESKNEQVLNVQKAINKQKNTITIVYPIIVIVLSISSVLLVLLLLNSLIINPLRQLINEITEIADGKYDIALNYDKDDELGELRNAATEIKSHIVDTVSSISLVKMDVETAFSLLIEVSKQISNGSDEQLHCTQQMEEIIEELVHIAKELEQQSDNAHLSTNTVLEKSNQCNQQMIDSSKDMFALAKQVESTSQIIKQLDQEAGSVSSVLDVITSIAEQTNLLALNAAIEAARAGEAGRGFAVVADEVRMLATKTQQSTLDIGEIIKSLQVAAKQAVEAMNESESITAKNHEQSNLVRASLNEISEEMGNMTSQSQLVSDISSRQVNINNQLNENLKHLKSVTDNYQEIANSNTVSSSVNKATDDLNKMVEKLTGNLAHNEVELF